MRSACWSDVPNLKPPPVEASGHQDSVSLQLSACAWGLQNISDSAWPRGLEVQGRDVQSETLAAYWPSKSAIRGFWLLTFTWRSSVFGNTVRGRLGSCATDWKLPTPKRTKALPSSPAEGPESLDCPESEIEESTGA